MILKQANSFKKVCNDSSLIFLPCVLCIFCFNIHQHGRQILHFKLHVDGCKFHYRRPQVVHRCITQSICFVNKAAPPITQVGLGHVIGCLGRRIRSGL